MPELSYFYLRWHISRSESDLNALTWAAARRMRATLPQAGPAEIEIEVSAMFPEN